MDDVAQALIDTVEFDEDDVRSIYMMDYLLHEPDSSRKGQYISALRDVARRRLEMWKFN